jgi:hypothetical protein
MGKFYTATEELKNYLVEKGLTFHDRENPEVSYYTDHNTGNQIKVDIKNQIVSLLNNFGLLIDISSCFTDNQINKFLAN